MQQQRQCRDAVEYRHLHVEQDDFRIGAVQLVERVLSGAERSDDLQIRLGVDPARHQPADHDSVIHDHHADRLLRHG